MKNARLSTARGISLSLRNIIYGNGNDDYATMADFMDALEDSTTADELVRNLNRIKLVGFYNPTIDRDTPNYVRLKAKDGMGNIHYMVVNKD